MTKTFGNLIYDMRNRRRLNLRELAGRSDLHYSTLCRLEHDEVTPSLETIYKLAKGLNVHCIELVAAYYLYTYQEEELQ